MHCDSHPDLQFIVAATEKFRSSHLSPQTWVLFPCILIPCSRASQYKVKPKLNTMFNTALQWGQTQLNALFFVVLCCISELESFRRSWGVDCHESESDPLLNFSPSWSYFPLLIKEDDLNRTSPFLIDVDDISHFSFSPSRLYKSHV